MHLDNFCPSCGMHALSYCVVTSQNFDDFKFVGALAACHATADESKCWSLPPCEGVACQHLRA